jgi:hypothetical protein
VGYDKGAQMTKSTRLSIAAPTRHRIPHGAISADAGISDSQNVPSSDEEVVRGPQRGKPGRPPKKANEKARQVSVTLFPRESEGLDKLVEAVHAHCGLPTGMIVRSQIARLAVLRLMELSPGQVLDELKRLKP